MATQFKSFSLFESLSRSAESARGNINRARMIAATMVAARAAKSEGNARCIATRPVKHKSPAIENLKRLGFRSLLPRSFISHISLRWITSVLSERRTQFADERRSDVKYQTLNIAYSATNQLQGHLRFGSTHCYPAVVLLVLTLYLCSRNQK